MATVKSRIVVDTDVLADHLVTRRHPSALRVAMGERFCYATVFSAIELFAAANTPGEVRQIERTLSAMKILGMNGKAGKHVGLLVRKSGEHPGIGQLIAGLCVESGLPLLTMRPGRYAGIKGLRIIRATER